MFDDIQKEIPEIKGLKKLNVGDTVRVLTMNRKEQATNSIKGFTAKWIQGLAQIANPKLNFRYWVGIGKAYFRHELLRIPPRVDQEVIDLVAKKQTVMVPDDENWSDLESEYDPEVGMILFLYAVSNSLHSSKCVLTHLIWSFFLSDRGNSFRINTNFGSSKTLLTRF